MTVKKKSPIPAMDQTFTILSSADRKGVTKLILLDIFSDYQLFH